MDISKIIQKIKRAPLWLNVSLLTIISFIYVLYSQFQSSALMVSRTKKVYYVDNISEAHQIIIDMFNEKYKGEIEVVPINLPFYQFTTNDRKEILTRSLRSRSDVIDVFAVDLIWIQRFAKWGSNLDTSIDYSTLSHVNNKALEICYQDGHIVAMPLFLDIGVLYYRKDILYELPDGKEIEKRLKKSMTWDEFRELGKRFKLLGKPYPFYLFVGGDYEGMICCFHDMLTNEESDSMFLGNKINLNTASAVRVLRDLVDFIYKYKFTPLEVTKFDEYASYAYANEKDAVTLRAWLGYDKQYKGLLSDTSKIRLFGIAPLPHYKHSNTSAVLGGWCLMVSKYSPRQEEALKFVKFMFDVESQKLLYEYGGYLPVNMKVYSDSAYIKSYPELLQWLELLKWGRHRPQLSNYTRISEIMARAFHRVLRKEISVESALKLATTQINEEKVILNRKLAEEK